MASNHTSEASVKEEEGGGSSRTTRTTPRTTRIGFRGFRTLPISSPPLGGLLICMVLKPLKPILVVLGLVLVVLELPPPSSSFTEASEVWVQVAWVPLNN